LLIKRIYIIIPIVLCFVFKREKTILRMNAFEKSEGRKHCYEMIN